MKRAETMLLSITALYFYCRYFNCSPLFGLFAPVTKVTLAPVSNVVASAPAMSSLPRRPSVQLTPHHTSAEPHHIVTALAQERSGSQESLSSMSSVTSSASRSRVRLGISATAAGSNKVRVAPEGCFLVSVLIHSSLSLMAGAEFQQQVKL
jgi:hypothetical protein